MVMRASSAVEAAVTDPSRRGGEQGLGRRDGSLLRGQVQGGEAQPVGHVGVCALAEQRADGSSVIGQRGLVQWGPALGIDAGHVRPPRRQLVRRASR